MSTYNFNKSFVKMFPNETKPNATKVIELLQKLEKKYQEHCDFETQKQNDQGITEVQIQAFPCIKTIIRHILITSGKHKLAKNLLANKQSQKMLDLLLETKPVKATCHNQI